MVNIDNLYVCFPKIGANKRIFHTRVHNIKGILLCKYERESIANLQIWRWRNWIEEMIDMHSFDITRLLFWFDLLHVCIGILRRALQLNWILEIRYDYIRIFCGDIFLRITSFELLRAKSSNQLYEVHNSTPWASVKPAYHRVCIISIWMHCSYS